MISSRAARWLALLVLVAAVAAGVFFFWPRPAPLPAPGSAEYREYVRTFYIGVAALDAGRDELALEKLGKATQLVPSEPAAWADLGLLHLRKNNLQEADRDLKRARRAGVR
ncbi:MAG: hypothetical protein U0793_12470 [Gemmataceae bacterium]